MRTRVILTLASPGDMYRKMASDGEQIGKALKLVLERMQNAVTKRPKTLPQVNPRLVAVSKTKPASDILIAYQHGQRHFGENYLNELQEKCQNEVLRQCPDIRWHYVGMLQSNKTKKLAEVINLYMVETVQTQKVAQTLNNHWEKYRRSGTLQVMVQVNTSGEDNKSGCEPDQVVPIVTVIREKCPCLKFAGLMTIGAVGYDPANGPNPDFLTLLRCREEVCRALSLPLEEVELSMGMSSDYEHAIEIGSTNIRVGSTIFGARDTPGKAVIQGAPLSLTREPRGDGDAGTPGAVGEGPQSSGDIRSAQSEDSSDTRPTTNSSQDELTDSLERMQLQN